jgi:hypothetical protein
VVPPACATTFARSAACPYAGLAYGPPAAPHAIGLQPHPEFTAGFLDDLLARRAGDAIPEPLARAGRATLERPVAGDFWARWLAGFLRRAASRGAAAR